MNEANGIFLPYRVLGYVSNQIPLQVRYVKSRQENLIVTCVGKSFNTYGITHFGLLSVGGLHPEDITCMASDTFHIYTACQNNIYAWRRGTELKHIYKGHKSPVHLMLPFGPHLISVDEQNLLKIWEIKNETIFLELAFSSKTFKITVLTHIKTFINKILLGSEQGQLQLWNINKSKLIYTFKGWSSAVTCVEQIPYYVDGAAIGLASGKIILQDLRKDITLTEFVQDWGQVTSISFRTDGCHIMATGSILGHIVFWDLDEERVHSQLLGAHGDHVTGMICLPNEPLMLTSSPDNTLKLWIFDMSDGGGRLLRIREGHASPPSFIRFYGSNGHNILSSAPDSTLRIFNTKTEQFNKSLGKASYNRKVSKKRGHNVEDNLIMPPITQFTSETTREKEWDNIAAVHQGISTVTTWSYDKLRMGEHKLLAERFKKKSAAYLNTEIEATSICLTHCGNFIIIGYNTGHVDRFNMQSGIWRGSYGDPKAHNSPVRGILIDCLNQLTITGGSDCFLHFFKFKDNGLAPLVSISLDAPVSFFRFHKDRSLLAVILETFEVFIVDIDTKRIIRTFVNFEAQITDATFSPNSRWLITSSMDCSIKTWDISSSQLIDHFKTEKPCISLDMSPVSDVLATVHVDYLGIFLWANRTLYNKITLKAISLDEKPRLISLPECLIELPDEDILQPEEDNAINAVSSEQISTELVTLSGISGSRWQNLLNLDLIKKKNKPILPPTKSKAAPFFLPTIASLNLQFNLNDQQNAQAQSKLLRTFSAKNLTEFGKLLESCKTERDFKVANDKLKTFGPSVIDFEIKSLGINNGGSSGTMLQFMKLIEFVLKSNLDFELVESYLALFLKIHGVTFVEDEALRAYLPNIQSCHDVLWHKLHERLLYNIAVVQNLKI